VNIDLEGNACESEAARLLPWFVSGRLSGADGERVSRHLEHCEICRTDLAEQRALRATFKADGPVEYAPQAGLAKTLARVDELTREAPPAAMAATVPASGRRRFATTKWLTAAVVVQSIGLGVLGVSLLERSATDAASAHYQTLSAPTAVDSGPRIRAVFIPTMTLADLTTLLGTQRLRIVSGPSEAGVFTLAAVDTALDHRKLDARLAALRADAQVLFAEPAVDGGVQPR
jgi:anti-sigma factor RsiW